MESVKPQEFNRLAMQKSAPVVRSLTAALDQSQCSLAEGCMFMVNQQGRIVFAEYETGAAVRRHPSYVVARNALGAYWFIDKKGRCLPLD